MALADYRRKRHFNRTAEPRGKLPAGRSSGWRFVIQKHAARRLHYDFRLEHDGVLKSWAVPQGPSLDPTQKRLAVQVEDHPLEYGDFAGIIPAGEYGGGTVLLWDHGTWSSEQDVAAALKLGKLKFRLDGEKLHGRWALIRLRARPDEKGENWLLTKERDDEARTLSEFDVLEERPESVSSGRSLNEIAADPKRTWHSNRPSTIGANTTPKSSREKSAAKHRPAGIGAPCPATSNRNWPLFARLATGMAAGRSRIEILFPSITRRIRML